MDTKSILGRRPRELRRRVVLPARVRTSTGWSDACILNVSSRGLLIHARGVGEEGATIELRHRDHAIAARIMWRDGARAGLSCDDRVPVEDIMALGLEHVSTLSAEPAPNVERRRAPRSDESRSRGRMIEFAGAIAIAIVLTSGMAAMMQSALARPMASISTALGR